MRNLRFPTQQTLERIHKRQMALILLQDHIEVSIAFCTKSILVLPEGFHRSAK